LAQEAFAGHRAPARPRSIFVQASKLLSRIFPLLHVVLYGIGK
jgi:hypothetical protein